ncbi:MAG: hypothetical protein WAL22_13550 [Solirubrobacteraceae bacterium]
MSAPEPREFAIRVAAIDDLFVALDARPVAERPLRDEVRLWVLDEWELVRDGRPTVLHVHAPARERAATDEHAVGVAVRADLRAHARRLHYANPLNRRERIAVWAGVVIFLITIAVSTLLDKEFTGVLIAGISQGIVVIGWVALWDPAQRVAGDIVPHYFLRKRYAELAEIELRFAWHDTPGDVPVAVDLA